MDGHSANMNLSLWETLRPVDRKFTKPITGKSYKGDSPNPTYVIYKLTEVLGPIGHRWGFEVEYDRIRYGKPHQIVLRKSQSMSLPDGEGKQHVLERNEEYQIVREEYHEVCIRFWIADADGNTRSFSAFGGTPMLHMTQSGKWIHDEDAAKKSLTDAYTKAASWLGACADIFLGLFDDKYGATEVASVGESLPAEAKQAQHRPSAPPAARQTTSDTGW